MEGEKYHSPYYPQTRGAPSRSVGSVQHDLQTYKVPELIKALPVNNPVEWLLALHLPHLLSFAVAEDQKLVNYAISIARLAAQKAERGEAGEAEIVQAAGTLFQQLVELIKVFKRNSQQVDDQTVPYDVMSPEATAISTLF